MIKLAQTANFVYVQMTMTEWQYLTQGVNVADGQSISADWIYTFERRLSDQISQIKEKIEQASRLLSENQAVLRINESLQDRKTEPGQPPTDS